MTSYVRPVDPGFCPDCFASGDCGRPDAWRLPNANEAGRSLQNGGAPVNETHLPWNDGKHRRYTNFDSSLVPADGRWTGTSAPNDTGGSAPSIRDRRRHDLTNPQGV
jgi:hypothetical protein